MENVEVMYVVCVCVYVCTYIEYSICTTVKYGYWRRRNRGGERERRRGRKEYSISLE